MLDCVAEGSLCVKLCDFGCSVQLIAPTATQPDSARKLTWYQDVWCCTTHGYAAVESLDKHIFSTASDIFSAGAILLELHLGRPLLTFLCLQMNPRSDSQAWTREREVQVAGALRKFLVSLPDLLVSAKCQKQHLGSPSIETTEVEGISTIEKCILLSLGKAWGDRWTVFDFSSAIAAQWPPSSLPSPTAELQPAVPPDAVVALSLLSAPELRRRRYTTKTAAPSCGASDATTQHNQGVLQKRPRWRQLPGDKTIATTEVPSSDLCPECIEVNVPTTRYADAAVKKGTCRASSWFLPAAAVSPSALRKLLSMIKQGGSALKAVRCNDDTVMLSCRQPVDKGVMQALIEDIVMQPISLSASPLFFSQP